MEKIGGATAIQRDTGSCTDSIRKRSSEGEERGLQGVQRFSEAPGRAENYQKQVYADERRGRCPETEGGYERPGDLGYPRSAC